MWGEKSPPGIDASLRGWPARIRVRDARPDERSRAPDGREPCRLPCPRGTTTQRDAAKWTGEENRNCRGGVDSSALYGVGWPRVRRRTHERDDHTCQRCGDNRDDLAQYSDIHHVQPVRTFDDPRDAHMFPNLVCLCRDCRLAVERGAVTLDGK